MFRSEATFRGLLESAPDAMVIVDPEGRIVLVNTAAEQLFGYERAAMIGQPVEILVPDQFQRVHSGHRAKYTGEPRTRPMGVGLDLHGRRSDGSNFPAEISLSPLHSPEGMLITAVIRDVTDRRRAAELLERQVQERTAHLQVLLGLSKELLLSQGLDQVLQRVLSYAMSLTPEMQAGAIYLAEQGQERLTLAASAGFAPLPQITVEASLPLVEAVVGQRQSIVVSSPDQWADLITRFPTTMQSGLLAALRLSEPPTGLLLLPLNAADSAVGLLLLLRTTGEGPLGAASRPTLEGLANLAASAIMAEWSARDAARLSTRLAEAEAQQLQMAEQLTVAEAGMLQAARLAAVGQLAASVAHEINNPLYAARNCLYLLEDDLPADLRDHTYLGMARDQLARIATIIERMRDFYRPPRGEMVLANLNTLVEETLTLTGLNVRHIPMEMIFTPDPALQPVRSNPDQLRQVLLNLTLNAIEAMPEGGTLTVRTITRPTISVIEIADTGTGIPADVRARIFEPFFTTKSNGTGLGLAISAHIVTQHGGQLEVESEPGRGTIFRILLPAASRADAAKEENS